MDYMYESEHTKFMRELLEKNPQLAEKRIAARSIWWDKKLDKDEHKRFSESNIAQKPYTNFSGS